MADNINVDPGTGGSAVPVATDDVGGIQYQVIKLATGGDGVATFISTANPVPISDAGGSLTVDGTVAVSGSVAITGTVTANVGTGTQPISGTVAATQSGTWNIATVTTLPAVTVNGISTTAPDRGAGSTTAQTLRVSIASEQVEVGEYEAVPSTSSTTTTLGATGATGDFLASLLIVPLTVNPGSISIKDGSDTAILVFQGGTASVSNLVPFSINVGITSRTGAWQVVTGSGGNVQALATGNFT